MEIGDLEKCSVAVRVIGPSSTKTVSEKAAVRKGLTKKTDSALSSIPLGQLADEDWHAVCQAIHKGVEGAEWEKPYHEFVETKEAVNVRHQSGNSRAKTSWKSTIGT